MNDNQEQIAADILAREFDSRLTTSEPIARPRPNACVIHAYADGKVVQFKRDMLDPLDEVWMDYYSSTTIIPLGALTSGGVSIGWRVKPRPIVFQYSAALVNGIPCVNIAVDGQLTLTFDDGKLIDAKLLPTG